MKEQKSVSDGGSSSYYELPVGATELDDLIVEKDMPWHVANIFKACYRLGEKNDVEYEINKIKWFASRLSAYPYHARRVRGMDSKDVRSTGSEIEQALLETHWQERGR